MIFFNPAMMRAATTLASEHLQKIASILSKCDPKWGQDFQESCQQCDDRKANDVLTCALTDLLGFDATYCHFAFSDFCRQFGVDLNFAGMVDEERIHLVASNREAILKGIATVEKSSGKKRRKAQ